MGAYFDICYLYLRQINYVFFIHLKLMIYIFWGIFTK